MKILIFAVALFITLTSSAQYYYKDVIGTKESADLISNYRNNKVRRVVVNSYDGNNVRIDNFAVQQEFSPATRSLKTNTASDAGTQSVLTSYIDENGRV